LVALPCDATSACAKDRGGGCGAGTAVVEGSAMGDGTTLEGAAVGNNHSACMYDMNAFKIPKIASFLIF